MSSPAANTNGAHGKKPLERITFRFCSECSNMLYPKENEDERKLMFTCRTCNYSEEATSMCIYRNVLNNAVGETAGVTQDVSSDPTVGSPSSSTLSTTLAPASISSPASSKPSEGGSVGCCYSCGRMIMCERCGLRLAVLPVDEDDYDMAIPPLFTTSNDGDAVLSPVYQQDEVEIQPWSHSIDTLVNYVARSQGFFGDLEDIEGGEEVEEEVVEIENPEEKTAVDQPLGAF